MYKITQTYIVVLLLSISTYSQLLDKPTDIEILPCYVKTGQTSDCLVCRKPKQNQPDDDIAWHFQDTPVSRGTMTFKSGYKAERTRYNEIKLIIKPISENNVGIYSCSDISTKPNKLLRMYNIILQAKPIIQPVNTTLIVPEGDTIALWCNATSPVPMNKYNATWYLHSNDSDRSIGITGNKLEIQNITRQCGAIYRCIVRNMEGKTHLDFTVTVHSKPSIQILFEANKAEITVPHTNQQTIALDTNMIMKCWVHGEPEVTSIQWYKSDKLMGEWNKTTNYIQTEKTFQKRYMINVQTKDAYPTLVLKFQSTDTDYDTFKCVASNSIGSQSEFVTFVK